MAVYKLPNEYQLVEYLESTNSYQDDLGRCWFNIPININSTNLKIRGKVSNWTWMGREIGEYILYTMHNVADASYVDNTPWRFLKGSTNGSTIASVNGANNDYYFTSDEFSTQPFIFEQTNTYINILGNQQVSLSGGVSFTVSNVIFFRFAKFRLHFVEIYDGGTLALLLIPCFHKSDGESGLYDVINGVFYTNQGTGKFNLGSYVVAFNTHTLPKTYKLVEYLESTGTQYIDLGYLIPINATVKALCKFTKTYTSIAMFFGHTTENNSGNGNMCYLGLDATGERIYLATNTAQHNGPTSEAYNYTEKKFINRRDNVDDNFGLTVHNYYIDKGVSGISTYLFGRHGITSSLLSSCRFGSFSIEYYGKYICYLVSCYRISDNTPGMYDLMTQTFYTNQGTGNFILGPEIKYLYSTFNTLLKRRRLMMQQYKGTLRGLNVNRCYFPTGINGAGDVCVEVKLALNAYGFIFGSRIGLRNKQFTILIDQPQYNYRIRFDYGNLITYPGGNIILGRTYTLKLDKGKYYVNGSMVGSIAQSTFDNGLEMYLCGFNNNGSISSIRVDFYYAKIWKNDVLVRDYIPSMVGGVYGLYDNVSGSFSTFSGDGTISPIL